MASVWGCVRVVSSRHIRRMTRLASCRRVRPVWAPGRGRKPEIAAAVVEAIVDDTLHSVPEDGSAAWSTRSMAQRHGVGKDTVARVWRARELRPWRTDTFKLSQDRDFEAKLVDVVGL